MIYDIKFKPLQLPKLNDILGIEDDVDFKFVYNNPESKDIDGFFYSGMYRIKDNTLLYSEDIPFSKSNYSINDLTSKDFVGIKILK